MDLKYCAHYEFGKFITFTEDFTDSFLGSQSAEEFMEYSQEKDIKKAVIAYLAEIEYNKDSLAEDLEYTEENMQEFEDDNVWNEFVSSFVYYIEKALE